MTTFNEIGRTYASQIRAASETVVAKTASVGDVPVQFIATVNEVLADLDTWTNNDGTPLSLEQVRLLCRSVDDELGLAEDSFWSVKKGSVQNLIAYQRQVLLMYNSLRYR